MSKRDLPLASEPQTPEDQVGSDNRRKYVNGERPLTNAERVRRYRAAKVARAKACPELEPPMIQMNVWIQSGSREKLKAVAQSRGLSMGKLIEEFAEEAYEEVFAVGVSCPPPK